MLGDANGDGKVNSADLLKVVNHLNGNSALTSTYKTSADINEDGKINSADLLKIVNHLNGSRNISL